MKLYTRHDEALEFLRLWATGHGDPDDVDRRGALAALGPNPDPDEVDGVMGSKHCEVTCHECGASVEAAVVMRLDLGVWRKHDVQLCEQCLERALSLLRGEP